MTGSEGARAREVGVLFVCMGNICRSPTAEGVFRHAIARAGLGSQIRIDSAGTGVVGELHEMLYW